jgi:glycosyltransferase involved in cell wall biosynthesis
LSRPRVAIVHDYLTQRGGAERVVLALHRMFPDAPIFTSLYDPDGTFPAFSKVDIRTSPLNRVAALRVSHRTALPLLAPAFSAMEIDADVVICSSSGWAHGVRTRGRKVVYCHAPARWLYQPDAYLAGSRLATRTALAALRPVLRRWDQRAARSADTYIANSNYTRGLIRATYGIDAEVAWPPSGVDASGQRGEPMPVPAGYFLCVSRLLSYKNVAAVVDAFRDLPGEQLVLVGTGPQENVLRQRAPVNVTLLRSVTDPELRALYANARALLAASFEDFGLTPVEAATFGVPAITLRRGGYLDTVVEDTTGLFFDVAEPGPIARAVRAFSDMAFDVGKIQQHARQFDEDHFRARVCALSGTNPVPESKP